MSAGRATNQPPRETTLEARGKPEGECPAQVADHGRRDSQEDPPRN